MGARGPQPKPNVLKLISGNPGKRPLNLADVNPEVALPTAPAHLTAEALKEWKRVGAELTALGLVSRIDRAALALYCQAWGHMVLLERSLAADVKLDLSKDGDGSRAFYFVTDKGYQAQAVKVQLINSLREQVARYLKAFGMDPSSRSRVTASPQGQLPGMEEPTGWAAFR
jgi:P27 family predicted phage terminase small subunit